MNFKKKMSMTLGTSPHPPHLSPAISSCMLYSTPRAIHLKYYIRLLRFDLVVYPTEHAVSFVGMFWWIHCQNEALHALRNVEIPSVFNLKDPPVNLPRENRLLSLECTR
jgi:hypothetical protein